MLEMVGHSAGPGAIDLREQSRQRLRPLRPADVVN